MANREDRSDTSTGSIAGCSSVDATDDSTPLDNAPAAGAFGAAAGTGPETADAVSREHMVAAMASETTPTRTRDPRRTVAICLFRIFGWCVMCFTFGSRR
ncbi:hypothetical protein [Nocardioides acrostichi]|uniref:hypothetical protein n=1 Tax=Nocardioides acrostichi TaxID=2784339 RepID=UPI001A9C2CFE|nr:hypothetical protein [Nocardioides acrostichi]